MARGDQDALVVLDGTALVYRAFHGGARWTAADGSEVGAVHAFAQRLARWLGNARSRHFAVVWDAAGDSFRKQIDPGYKARRLAPPDALVGQLARARELTRALALTSLTVPGFEADDLMATLAARARGDGLAVWLVTPDKDLYQLVDDAPPAVRVFNPVSKTVFDEARVAATLGVPARAAVDYFALAGDSSDGVPGVRGVGPRAAMELIRAFESLDGLYARLDEVPGLALRGAAGIRTRLDAGRADAERSRRLVALSAQAPLGLTVPLRAATLWRGPGPEAEAVFNALGFTGPLRALGRPRGG